MSNIDNELLINSISQPILRTEASLETSNDLESDERMSVCSNHVIAVDMIKPHQ
jgi:hypothetical protein